MPQLPRISAAEWEVMIVIWDRHPVTASEVVEQLSQKAWSPRTIKSMLGRLVKKGALAVEAEGNRYLYRPRVSREACVAGETRSFVERVFGGDPASLLVHFAHERVISVEDLAELKRILAKKSSKKS